MLQHYFYDVHTPQQDTRSRTNSANSPFTTSASSPPTSPHGRRERAMSSSSASSSASASPILEPTRTLSPTSTSSSSAAALYYRPRKVSSQSQIPEAIPEHDVPEFKLQASPIDQDPLDVKANLTELLNCDQVRSDPKMRQWIQSRLMDAELELKRQRRRRVSLPMSASGGEDTSMRRTGS